jgi:hypothetical protein
MADRDGEDKGKGSDAVAGGEARRPPHEAKRGQINLGWKDYLAITIASFETILLPLLVLLGVLVVLILVLAFVR